MTKEQRGPLPPEEEKRTQIALFRYGLIAPLLHRPIERGEIASHCRAVAAQRQQIPFSKRTSINPDTIWSYLASYRKGGFEALKPQTRDDAGRPRRVPEEIIQKAIALREEQPSRSVSTIIEILRRDPSVQPNLALKGRTLRAILQKRGKSREQLIGQSKAFRRFEREAANVLWQGDMLVGPYLPDVNRPGKYLRTALFCFIDDYSRLIPYGEFFFEESLPRLERVLKISILRRGIPQSLYVDNGKVYVSVQLAAACATLGIRQIHSTPYTPNTRGKIERFFGTVRSQFLSEVEVAKISDPTRYSVVYTANPLIGITGLYREVLLQLGEPVPMFRPRMVLGLRRCFEVLTNERKKTPVLIVDEAHLLDHRMLEELRLLLNVRMDSQAAAALVLVGHSELRRTLRLSIHEALWQRTGVRFHLRPLDLTETGAYIRHQVEVAGYRGGTLFSDGFVAKAYDYTKGIPRQINLVCTHALMAGCAEQKQVLDETVLRQVINDLETGI